MAPRLLESTRKEIVDFLKKGLSCRKIAKLANCHYSSVSKINKVLQNKLESAVGKSCGRPRKISKSDDRYIKLISKRNRRKTLPVIATEFNSVNDNKVSESSVRRSLLRNEMFGRVALKKPLLRKENIEKRYRFAIEHKDWTVEQWNRVLWTDESKFELFGTKRRVHIRRGIHEKTMKECIVPTVKHGGGSIMVWGGMCSSGVIPLVQIEGIMLKENYHTILTRNALPGGKRLLGPGFIFQQDNDPKHTAIINKKYLANQEKKGKLVNYNCN